MSEPREPARGETERAREAAVRGDEADAAGRRGKGTGKVIGGAAPENGRDLAGVRRGSGPAWIGRGARIAQLLVRPVCRVRFQETRGLPETKRGGGGFGHTGV